MFEEEFHGLPAEIANALRNQLEENIRLIYGRYSHSRRDFSANAFTKEQINAMVFSVFDVANRLRITFSEPDAS